MPRASKEKSREDRGAVVDALLRDPSATAESLASATGLSQQQVYRILRALEEEGVIAGRPVQIDLAKLHKKRYIIMAKRGSGMPDGVTLSSSCYSEEFVRAMKEQGIDIIPEDDYTCAGEYDMVTVIIADDFMEASKYMEFLRATSKGYFVKFSVMEVLFTTRRNLLPTADMERFQSYVREVMEYRNGQ
jgi:DNA-binding Lrp family transcriptional regulator